MPILQVISTSPFDSIQIQKAGANRIQLVSALQIGGLTPSAAIIRKALQCVDIPTMVMIRHHNNGFVHTEQQIELFCQQINSCKQMGVKGIVFGGITNNYQIDQHLIQSIYKSLDTNKIDVTFHKAFDQVGNIQRSYQVLAKYNINRVLTQGGTQPIQKNFYILNKIISFSNSTINSPSLQNYPKVLLGGGINFDNIKQILEITDAKQIHIGTCVRQNKYGPVIKEKIQQFIGLM